MNPNPASLISESVQPRQVVAKLRARARAPAPISHWKRHRLSTGGNWDRARSDFSLGMVPGGSP
jgi:hypothetical protein